MRKRSEQRLWVGAHLVSKAGVHMRCMFAVRKFEDMALACPSAWESW
jgi:hypothetical protein